MVATADTGPAPWVAVGWLAGGAVLTFAVSWLGTTVFGLQHDLYYLIYLTFALGYLAVFVRRSGVALREVLRRNLWWSLAVGVLVGAAVVSQVLGQDGTGHPGGTFCGFELAWRCIVYGSVDALILCVFPALLAWLMLHGNRTGAKRKFAFAGLVLMFSLLISAAYHLGYTTYHGHGPRQAGDR